jgi:hypothetical protein
MMMIMKHAGYLPEKKMKYILEEYLASQGWARENAIFNNQDIDLEVSRGDEKWRVQIKSAICLTDEIINSFVSALGQILQRMDDSSCKYSIALPDTRPFRRLWERVPRLAKSRTGITALFISETGEVKEIPG